MPDPGPSAATGKIFVISAPSGAGKTTLTREILNAFPDVSFSVSHTTRSPREGELDTVDYFFISTDRFEQMIREKKWLEWARVHGNYYGTSRETVMDRIDRGRHLLLEIDVQGARQVKAAYQKAVTIFIMPPSMAVLEERLRKRGTDEEAVILKRLQNAIEEIRQKDFFQYCVVNDDLDRATREILNIFKAELS